MPTPNVHTGDPFSLESMTLAVNSVPYRPGQISKSGIFEEDSVSTTIISVELRDGKLALVEPSERGGPGETTGDEERTKIAVEVPHYQRDDSVKADEVQNAKEFGTDNAFETVVGRVNRKAQRHAQDLTMTLEHQRVGAVKGVILSKSGKILVNCYNAFSIAVPAPIPLQLSTDTTKITDKFQDVIYSIEDSLDEPYDGLHVWTGRDFHKMLWQHKSVRETFLFNGSAVLRQDVPDVFEWGGATWERYKTGVKATADLGSPYFATDEARVVPKGVDGLFITRFAPADYSATVNSPGLPFYSQMIEMRNGKGYDMEVQMNAISLCSRPQVLRKLTIA